MGCNENDGNGERVKFLGYRLSRCRRAGAAGDGRLEADGVIIFSIAIIIIIATIIFIIISIIIAIIIIIMMRTSATLSLLLAVV